MAKLVDLRSIAQAETHIASDICVVGAGAAGLYLANRLSRNHLHITVLEAGGPTCISGAAIGIEATFTGSHYRGAEEGRAFGWGGTTSRWGGLLAPYSTLDRQETGGRDSAAWDHIVNVVKERSNGVLSTLGLGEAANFLSMPNVALGQNASLLRECGLELLAAEAVPFWRRNLTHLLTTRSAKSVDVFLHAVAYGWSVRAEADGSGSITSVAATSANGKKVHVAAKTFIIAAGAIESTRILLELDRSTDGRLIPSTAELGSYLSDHLSCSIANVHVDDRDKAALIFGPFFSKGRMRTLRFVNRSYAPVQARHFAHFIFDIDDAGFRLARDTLLGFQSRSLRHIRLRSVSAGLIRLSRFVYHRFVRSRLFVPRNTPARLQLDVEQTPDPANRVRLGMSMDAFGRPTAAVHWHVNAIDHENVRKLAHHLLLKWPRSTPAMPRLIPLLEVDKQVKPHDAYHPVGTCRIGDDTRAVADLSLRVRGTRNLYVLSTAVFPSAGTANPTFSMLCLGDMLADELAKNGAAFPLPDPIQ